MVTKMVNDVVTTVYEKLDSGEARQAGFEIIRFVESSFNNEDLNAVNLFLESLDVDRLEAYTISAALRSSCRAKKFLPAWQSLCDRSFEKLKLERGEEKAKRIMIGIHD